MDYTQHATAFEGYKIKHCKVHWLQMGILGTAQMEAWYIKLLLPLNIISPKELKFLLGFSSPTSKQYMCKEFPLGFVPRLTCSLNRGKWGLGEDWLTSSLNGMDTEGSGEV